MKYRYDIAKGIQKVKTKTFVAVAAFGLLVGGGGLSLALLGTANAAGGFDQYGYNDTARVFVGTCASWYQGKYGGTLTQAEAYCGPYSNDQLVMKWNKAWDDCVAGGYTDAACSGTGVMLTNEWNGMVPGGSGETEHFKATWYSQDYCGKDGAPLGDGGYCIWGHYEALMDQGMTDGSHWVLAHATPNGFGLN